jgi:hypothetical protein
MFKIRNEQARALTTLVRDNFEERAVRHLRDHEPAETAACSDAELRRRVRQGTPRAGKYGLTTEQQVMAFVDVTYLVGPEFDTDDGQPWARGVLTDPALEPDDKASLLLWLGRSVAQERRAREAQHG